MLECQAVCSMHLLRFAPSYQHCWSPLCSAKAAHCARCAGFMQLLTLRSCRLRSSYAADQLYVLVAMLGTKDVMALGIVTVS